MHRQMDSPFWVEPKSSGGLAPPGPDKTVHAHQRQADDMHARMMQARIGCVEHAKWMTQTGQKDTCKRARLV